MQIYVSLTEIEQKVRSKNSIESCFDRNLRSLYAESMANASFVTAEFAVKGVEATYPSSSQVEEISVKSIIIAARANFVCTE